MLPKTINHTISSNNIIDGTKLFIPKSKSSSSHTTSKPFTKEEISAAKNYFLTRPERYKGQNIRDWCIFVVGINTARRAGDLLKLKVSDIFNSDFTFKKHIVIFEGKTGKLAEMILTPVLKDAISKYIQTFDDININSPLFPSRNKDKETGEIKSMTVNNFNKKLKALKHELNIEHNVGCHSLRKAWGYHTLKNNPEAMASIMKYYNHSKWEITERYVCIDQDRVDELCYNNQL